MNFRKGHYLEIYCDGISDLLYLSINILGRKDSLL